MRPTKPHPAARWISTRAEYQFDAELNRYVLVDDAGYWYVGPLALAHEIVNTGMEAWRAYNSSGTPLAAQNVDISLDVDTPIQVCFRVKNTSNDTSDNNQAYTLQYNVSGSWVSVTASSAKIQAATAGLTDDATYGTDRLTGGTETRENGHEETSGTTPNISLGVNTYCEIVYGMTIVSADVNNDDAFTLRLVQTGDLALDFYTVSPVITAVKATPQTVTLVPDSFTLSDGTLTVFAEQETRVTPIADSFTLSDGTLTINQAVATTVDLVADSFTLSDGTLSVFAEQETRVSLVADALTLSDGTLSVTRAFNVNLVADAFTLSDGTLTIVAENEAVISLIADALALADGTLSIQQAMPVTVSLVADSFTLTDGTLGVSIGVSVDLVPDSFTLSDGALTVAQVWDVTLAPDAFTLSPGTLTIEGGIPAQAVTVLPQALALTESSIRITSGPTLAERTLVLGAEYRALTLPVEDRVITPLAETRTISANARGN